MFYLWVLRAKERGWGSEGWEMGHGTDIAGVRNIKLRTGMDLYLRETRGLSLPGFVPMCL